MTEEFSALLGRRSFRPPRAPRGQEKERKRF
jgi:hypothetical protein